MAAAADDDGDDRNNRCVGDDRWCGDALPPSLSLDVDEGGVGGSVKPENPNAARMILLYRM